MQDHSTTFVKQKIKKLLPRLKCAFHENQTLTNFCSSDKCLLPLCPTCIKIHTNEHINMRTDPQYQSLSDVVLNLNLQIKDYITTYEENHRRFTQTQQKIIQFKQQVFTNIENLKKSIIDEVQKFFTKLLLSTEHKISQMKYIQDLEKNKGELKKVLLNLKKLDKSLSEENVSGKFVIRNLIKYSSNQTSQNLQKFDSHCRQFLSKVQGNFCTFSLRDNLQTYIAQFLNQAFRININPIPTLQPNKIQEMLNITKKLQEMNIEGKASEKIQIKNTLTKVMGKVKTSLTSANKNLCSSQSQLNSTMNYENLTKQCKPQDFASISKKIFESNQKRRFTNHSSQRKSLNISRSFCSTDNSLQQIKPNRQNNYQSVGSKWQRRSSSKGKGLSLIQPRYAPNEQQQNNYLSQIRFSLSQIENVNFDFDISKVSFINKRK